jgi:hypothetical protein
MTPASPFEQAATSMPASNPAKHQHQLQQHQEQQQQQFVRPRKTGLAALLSCACCGNRPAVKESTGVAVSSLGSLSSEEADASGKHMLY